MTATGDLFAASEPEHEALGDGAAVLRGFALPMQALLLEDLHHVLAAAPLRHMVTPGGHTLSVAMSNCGMLGWISDRRGYRYEPIDPASGKPWPPLPESFVALAGRAAAAVDFAAFVPDGCLINRYVPGAKLSLHQDRDERDFNAPIVSVSLGMPAVFQFGGWHRGDPVRRVPLQHGDVVVWGGPARLRYHGVLPLKTQPHPLLGTQRYNFTLRKAG